MSDRYDENLFLGYVEGDLSPDDRARFERQMAADAPLRLLVEQVLRDRQSLREMPDEAAPPQIMEQVNQALERSMLFEEPAPPGRLVAGPQRFRLMRWGRYAAVAALVALSVGVLIRTLLITPVPLQLTNSNTLANAGSSKENSGGAAQPADGPQLALADRGKQGTLQELGAEGQFAKLSPDNEAREKRALAQLDFDSAGDRRADALAAADNDRMRETVPSANAGKPGDMKAAANPLAMRPGAGMAGAGSGGIGGGFGSKGAIAAEVTLQREESSAAPPRIEIAAADPAASEKSLLAWCVQNKVTVITTTEMVQKDEAPAATLALRENYDTGSQPASPAPGSAPGATPGSVPARGSVPKAAPPAPVHPSGETKDRVNQFKQGDAQFGYNLATSAQNHQVTVRIPAEQVPQLLLHLNADRSQTAQLVAAPGPVLQNMPAAEDLNPALVHGQLGASKMGVSATRPALDDGVVGGTTAKAPPAPGVIAPAPGFPAPGFPGAVAGGAPGPNAGPNAAAPAAGAEPLPSANQSQSATATQRDQSGGGGRNERSVAGKNAQTEAEALTKTDSGAVLRQQLPLRESARLGDTSKDLEIPVIIYQRDAAK